MIVVLAADVSELDRWLDHAARGVSPKRHDSGRQRAMVCAYIAVGFNDVTETFQRERSISMMACIYRLSRLSIHSSYINPSTHSCMHISSIQTIHAYLIHPYMHAYLIHPSTPTYPHGSVHLLALEHERTEQLLDLHHVSIVLFARIIHSVLEAFDAIREVTRVDANLYIVSNDVSKWWWW